MRGLEMPLRASLGKENEDSVSTLVMAKLDNTSGTVIAITFLVMNRCFLVAPGFLCVFMSIWKKNTCFCLEYNLQL
jgi:hypothetical protein